MAYRVNGGAVGYIKLAIAIVTRGPVAALSTVLIKAGNFLNKKVLPALPNAEVKFYLSEKEKQARTAYFNNLHK